MKQHRDPESYFSENEFIMCDTAYEPSWFCVSAFKSIIGGGFQLHPHKTLFINVLAKAQVICEHTMGLWKGLFCLLRNIRMKITNDKNHLKKILHYIVLRELSTICLQIGERQTKEILPGMNQ